MSSIISLFIDFFDTERRLSCFSGGLALRVSRIPTNLDVGYAMRSVFFYFALARTTFHSSVKA